MRATRTHVELIYEGTNITEDISPDLVSFDWNDNESGKADDISITLKNDHGLWSGEWFPQKGDTLTASIVHTDTDGVERAIFCGRFSVDELSFSGPPSTLTINAQSAALGDDARRTRRSKAWEEVSLRDIAQAVADVAGMTLIYDVSEAIEYDRIDQSREADISFLMRVCRQEGLSLKVSDEQLVVFSESDYEQRPPVDTISLGETRVISWSFETKAYELASEARVRYYDASKAQTVEHVVSAPAPAYTPPSWVPVPGREVERTTYDIPSWVPTPGGRS